MTDILANIFTHEYAWDPIDQKSRDEHDADIAGMRLTVDGQTPRTIEDLQQLLADSRAVIVYPDDAPEDAPGFTPEQFVAAVERGEYGYHTTARAHRCLVTIATITNAIARALSHQCALPQTRFEAEVWAFRTGAPVFPTAADCTDLRALQGAWEFVGRYANAQQPDLLPSGITGWQQVGSEGFILSHETTTGRLYVEACEGGRHSWGPAVTLQFYAGPADTAGDGRLVCTLTLRPDCGRLAVSLDTIDQELLDEKPWRVSLLTAIDRELGESLIPMLEFRAAAISEVLRNAEAAFVAYAAAHDAGRELAAV